LTKADEIVGEPLVLLIPETTDMVDLFQDHLGSDLYRVLEDCSQGGIQCSGFAEEVGTG
jgi:hypothetical protein